MTKRKRPLNYLAMEATCPATRSAHATSKLRDGLVDAYALGLRLFTRCNPTNPLIAR